MRSIAVLLTVLVASTLAACSAPTIGTYPDATGGDTTLPSRSSHSDDSDSTTTNTTGKGSTTSADTAPVTAKTLALTVSATGDGAGGVTSSPAGVTCTGNTCTGNFASGTNVTLTATPHPGSIFTGWTGGCTGTGTCATTMAGATTVTAQFITLAGSWTGSYTHTESANGCTFNNAGTLAQTIAGTDGAFTTAAQMGGFQIKDGGCNLVQTVSGESNASAATVAGLVVTGTWDVQLGQFGDLPLPFTATIVGSKMTGKWTCTGCTGGFDVSKATTATTTQ